MRVMALDINLKRSACAGKAKPGWQRFGMIREPLGTPKDGALPRGTQSSHRQRTAGAPPRKARIMKTSITLRLAAAAASICTTYVLFTMVASLAEPPQAAGAVQMAQTKTPPVR